MWSSPSEPGGEVRVGRREAPLLERAAASFESAHRERPLESKLVLEREKERERERARGARRKKPSRALGPLAPLALDDDDDDADAHCKQAFPSVHMLRREGVEVVGSSGTGSTPS